MTESLILDSGCDPKNVPRSVDVVANLSPFPFQIFPGEVCFKPQAVK